MGLGSILVAAGVGAAAVKVIERVKAANPDAAKHSADEYVNETIGLASDVANKAKDYAPVVVDKAKETAQKVKDSLNL